MEPRHGEGLAASDVPTRGPITTMLTPEGPASAFRGASTTRSRSQRSIGSGSAPTDATASTTIRAFLDLAILAIAARSFLTPVAASACTTLITSTAPSRSSAVSTSSGWTALSKGTVKSST